MGTNADFAIELGDKRRRAVESQLESFIVRHACHHRPIAVVSSGGTAVDLELSSVRCIENFSTGLRGAISVEEFLKRGYAVVHLWRVGSASPYGRILSQALDIPQADHGITDTAFGKLLAGDQSEDAEDQLVESVLNDQDPWMTDSSQPSATSTGRPSKKPSATSGLQLHRRLQNSTTLQGAVKDRATVLKEGRLLTLSFRSVEEYLAILQLSATAVRDSQSLSIFYLAAAVSDFYVPKTERSKHKIQSSGSKEGLTLQLKPVPKVLGLLRQHWAPDAFVCSFKLETDADILRYKAERAVKLYGCHMVVGNILSTRYDKVWVLSPPDRSNVDEVHNVSSWPMQEIRRPKHSESDALENLLMEHVIQSHFEYISMSCTEAGDRSGAEAAMAAHRNLDERMKKVKDELFWKKVTATCLEWGGILVGAVLSFAISSALQRRIGA